MCYALKPNYRAFWHNISQTSCIIKDNCIVRLFGLLLNYTGWDLWAVINKTNSDWLQIEAQSNTCSWTNEWTDVDVYSIKSAASCLYWSSYWTCQKWEWRSSFLRMWSRCLNLPATNNTCSKRTLACLVTAITEAKLLPSHTCTAVDGERQIVFWSLSDFAMIIFSTWESLTLSEK